MASIILLVAAALVLLGIAFAVIRLALGQTVIDRIAAVDMLTVISISIIALYAHVADRFIYLDVALVYGVLSFLGVMAVARYLERGL
ncbi:MAG: monovalent cation/H+ antiporter complex subunit F [Alphaproteobacteria bacterium]